MGHKEFSRDEIKLFDYARSIQDGDYEMRRNYFKRALNEFYNYRRNYHYARLVYGIGQHLVLDESDIIDFVEEYWGMSKDELYRLVW